MLSRGGDVKPDLREAFFWAAAANNNARIRPRGELTLEKVSRLAQMIRERLRYQTASKAGVAATRLTGTKHLPLPAGRSKIGVSPAFVGHGAFRTRDTDIRSDGQMDGQTDRKTGQKVGL